MKKIVLLQKIMMVLLLCGIHQLLIPSEDRLVDTMHGLHEKLVELNTKSAGCCLIPSPCYQLFLAQQYKETAYNYHNAEICEEKKLFDLHEKSEFDSSNCSISIAIGTICPVPLSAALVASSVVATEFSLVMLGSAACCCCLGCALCSYSNINFYQYQDLVQKQLAIKQLYTQGYVDNECKEYLKDYRNAYHVSNADSTRSAFVYFGIERENN
ncbi:hypothetical protein [Candidatus Chromulinivorax destructor]|uniref:Uncharacterized protein n=1 Tax=Candidatus Chromulinivorax destructor TaxID=2066483 RepID=A0A345ZA41_9BACT|nr:hypothetical protein [Candidatus Chromulinivorax destructor]AXK60158.1 hypothetical protein C0J27_00130 [Candidatus Chromulinivorax destructor]